MFCVLSVMHSLPVSHCTAVSDKLPTQVEVIDDDISVSGCQPHKETTTDQQHISQLTAASSSSSLRDTEAVARERCVGPGLGLI